MDKDQYRLRQKDYYKECIHMVIGFDRIWGNSIKLIFFKNENDYILGIVAKHLESSQLIDC